MYENTILIQQTIANSHHGKLETGNQARRQAAQQFWHRHLQASFALFIGRRRCLRSLEAITHTTRVIARRDRGIQVVPLNQITGSEGRAHDFDADFRPCQAHNMDRWIGIAAARRMGITLPPVELIQVGSQYFVRDGHHRISVAWALGQVEIDAHVIVWQVDN